MILTVTPNPSVDRSMTLSALHVGDVNRAEAVRSDAGGKGINVSRALSEHGYDTCALFPLGGAEGDFLLSMLKQAAIPTAPIRIAQEIRSNLTVLHATGTENQTTKINAPGPILTDDERASIINRIGFIATPGTVVVGAGSLPRGIPSDAYAQIARRVTDAGAQFVLDTSGQALRSALESAAEHIALTKPNKDEFAELLATSLDTVGDIVFHARALCARGIGAVVVSLGENGLLYVSNAHVFWAGTPAVHPVSTVGAGDMALAGFLSVAGSLSEDIEERVRRAGAWGAAAVQCEGTEVPSVAAVSQIHVVVVAEPDEALRLDQLGKVLSA